jgi:hypothetical protein
MSMTCKEFRERHPDLGPEGRTHEAACPECRDYAQCWELLKEYPSIEPRSGFFRAVRRKLAPRILRYAALVSAAAAVLLVAVIFRASPPTQKPEVVTEEERELVENLDLLQNYELLRTLEMVGENGSPLLEEKK